MLGEFLGKRIMQEVCEVTRIIDEKSQQIGEEIIYRWLPHISVRILNALSVHEFKFLCEDKSGDSTSNEAKKYITTKLRYFTLHYMSNLDLP